MDSRRAMTGHAIGTAATVLAFAAAASAQTPAGPEFRINTYSTSRQFQPSAAVQADGGFVVVWASNLQDGAFYGIFGRRYEGSGAPRGAEFRVNASTTGSERQPAVAIGGGGDFVAVWTSQQDGSGYSIQGRRFDAAGNPRGGEFLVNTYTTGFQTRPRVGLAADGRFVVSWVTEDGGAADTGIAARRFDAAGNPVGAEFLVNSNTLGNQAFGDIAVESNGNFVVVWEDCCNRDGDGLAIFGQRFDAAGNRLGSDFLVNSYTSHLQFSPAVSVSPAGGFVVAWTGEREDGSFMGIIGRRFDASGGAVGNDFVVNAYTTNNQQEAEVAHDARGNFVVSWTSYDANSYGSFAQRFDAAGARRGAEFRVNTYTTASQRASVVASDPVGNFVVGWTSSAQDGSGYGVFAQRFGGLLPAELDVDTAGNGVLEPGETAELRPSWRNVNGTAQIFTGALSGFAGPPGATYTITDAFADYLIVSNGATQACADCYGVSVSNPPARPALHWDATAIESITPDQHGQQKEWRLHVGKSFMDVPVANAFYRFVETLLHNDVTGGCGAGRYCPGNSTTREQMAVFVLAAKEGAGYVPPACGAPPLFGDVPAGSPYCRWIEELARRTVVGGCGGGNYCPAAAVTRDQMAVFVLRTLDASIDPPPCAMPMYGDVPANNPFCRWIEELTRRAVVSGCGGGSYCPTAAVTREQMGVFLAVTFGLSLYGL